MTVKQVLRKIIDDDEFPVQLINLSIKSVKLAREGGSEVTFLTAAMTPSQFQKEHEPVGLLLWIPREWL